MLNHRRHAPFGNNKILYILKLKLYIKRFSCYYLFLTQFRNIVGHFKQRLPEAKYLTVVTHIACSKHFTHFQFCFLINCLLYLYIRLYIFSTRFSILFKHQKKLLKKYLFRTLGVAGMIFVLKSYKHNFFRPWTQNIIF